MFLKYNTNVEDNNVNLPLWENNLRNFSSVTQQLYADADDFPDHFRALLDLIVSDTTRKYPRVTFDISVTATRLLLRCMKVLLEYDVSLRIIYSEAAVYHPTKEEHKLEQEARETDKTFSLERGVRQVLPSVVIRAMRLIRFRTS